MMKNAFPGTLSLGLLLAPSLLAGSLRDYSRNVEATASNVPAFAIGSAGQRRRAFQTHSNVAGHGRLQPSVAVAGAGMGMQDAEELLGGSKKKKKKKKAAASSKGLGMSSKGKKTTTADTPFDAAASLARSTKSYDAICLHFEKQRVAQGEDYNMSENAFFSEYMIAARCDASTAATAAVSDWVPVAQLCMVRPESVPASTLLQAAVSYYCREIHHAATVAAPGVFDGLARNALQYSVEPLDSFFKYVYENVVEEQGTSRGSKSKQQQQQQEDEDKDIASMTRAQARQILGLEDERDDLSAMKQAYRTLSLQYHPDRFAGMERSDEEARQTTAHYLRIKTAYETLRSGLRQPADANGAASWYESLGGRSRTDFVGPIVMTSRNQAQETLQKQRTGGGGSVWEQTAICEIDESLVMTFVAWNQLSARSP